MRLLEDLSLAGMRSVGCKINDINVRSMCGRPYNHSDKGESGPIGGHRMRLMTSMCMIIMACRYVLLTRLSPHSLT